MKKILPDKVVKEEEKIRRGIVPAKANAKRGRHGQVDDAKKLEYAPPIDKGRVGRHADIHVDDQRVCDRVQHQRSGHRQGDERAEGAIVGCSRPGG